MVVDRMKKVVAFGQMDGRMKDGTHIGIRITTGNPEHL